MKRIKLPLYYVEIGNVRSVELFTSLSEARQWVALKGEIAVECDGIFILKDGRTFHVRQSGSE